MLDHCGVDHTYSWFGFGASSHNVQWRYAECFLRQNSVHCRKSDSWTRRPSTLSWVVCYVLHPRMGNWLTWICSVILQYMAAVTWLLECRDRNLKNWGSYGVQALGLWSEFDLGNLSPWQWCINEQNLVSLLNCTPQVSCGTSETAKLLVTK